MKRDSHNTYNSTAAQAEAAAVTKVRAAAASKTPYETPYTYTLCMIHCAFDTVCCIRLCENFALAAERRRYFIEMNERKKKQNQNTRQTQNERICFRCLRMNEVTFGKLQQ